MTGGADSILSPPGEWKVTVGGEEHVIRECRPCDIPPLMEFIASMDAGGLRDSLSARLDGGAAAFDAAGLLSFVRGKPREVCVLMAAVLDPDPLGPGSAAWREAAAARFIAGFLTARATRLSLGGLRGRAGRPSGRK